MDRMISTELMEEDIAVEGRLRPQNLTEYIGQEKVKKNLSVFIEAAKMRGEALYHVVSVSYTQLDVYKRQELYDKVLEAHPQSFLARTGRMEAVLQEGRYREAREAILDLLEESPVDERLVADLNKANVYVIAELEPDYKENHLNQDSLMELAWCYYQNSRFEDGIASVSYTHLDVYKRQDCW